MERCEVCSKEATRKIIIECLLHKTKLVALVCPEHSTDPGPLTEGSCIKCSGRIKDQDRPQECSYCKEPAAFNVDIERIDDAEVSWSIVTCEKHVPNAR